MAPAWMSLLSEVNWRGWWSGGMQGALIGAGVGLGIWFIGCVMRQTGGKGPS